MGRFVVIFTILVFGVIGVMALNKQKKGVSETKPALEVVEIVAERQENLPSADHADRLFKPGTRQLPIVQTLSYRSRTDWMQGRPAWLGDYATNFKTSRHFIARSLHGQGNYQNFDITHGKKFNVINPDITFQLVIDLQRSRLWLFAIDPVQKKNYLIKDYEVGLGRHDNSSPSGLLTPLGNYALGDRTASYDTKTKSYFNGEKIPMISVFGTRWIPFEKELDGATAEAKGYGIHGLPWEQDPLTNEWSENGELIGKYESDGCIRLRADDMEELYAIVVSRPTIVQLVAQFEDAKVPGEAWQK